MIQRNPRRNHLRTTADGKIKIDTIDEEIIRILSEDSRTPILEISRRIYLSSGVVERRLRQLIEAGVIKRFTIEVDQEKLE